MSMFCKVKGRIIEKYGSQRAFAVAIGTTEQTVTSKLNGKSQFSLDDISVWCRALDISPGDVGSYFFADILSND